MALYSIVLAKKHFNKARIRNQKPNLPLKASLCLYVHPPSTIKVHVRTILLLTFSGLNGSYPEMNSKTIHHLCLLQQTFTAYFLLRPHPSIYQQQLLNDLYIVDEKFVYHIPCSGNVWQGESLANEHNIIKLKPSKRHMQMQYYITKRFHCTQTCQSFSPNIYQSVLLNIIATKHFHLTVHLITKGIVTMQALSLQTVIAMHVLCNCKVSY